MRPTNRTFTNVETTLISRLYMDDCTQAISLIYEDNNLHGQPVPSFFISAHTAQSIKINGSKIIEIGTGEFYELKEGEKVTHRKFIGFARFKKI